MSISRGPVVAGGNRLREREDRAARGIAGIHAPAAREPRHAVGSLGRLHEVAKHGARFDRRQLLRVAEEHQPAAGGQRAEEALGEDEVEHRAFVHEHQPLGERITLVTQEALAGGGVGEQAVQRRGGERLGEEAPVGVRRIGDADDRGA